MASPPPRPVRRRPRRGSLERPINARSYRGTWLLVAIPLLIAAFSVKKAPTLPPPGLPADLRHDRRARPRGRTGGVDPEPQAGYAGGAQSCELGRFEVRARGLHTDHRPLHRRHTRRRPDEAGERRRDRSRPLPAGDRPDVASRRHGRRPRSERQRLGHRRDARARAGLRQPRDRIGAPTRGLGAGAQHHLRLHRRWRVRSARRLPLRARTPPTATACSRSSTSTRSPARGRLRSSSRATRRVRRPRRSLQTGSCAAEGGRPRGSAASRRASLSSSTSAFRSTSTSRRRWSGVGSRP